jgi:hypothetical protein
VTFAQAMAGEPSETPHPMGSAPEAVIGSGRGLNHAGMDNTNSHDIDPMLR